MRLPAVFLLLLLTGKLIAQNVSNEPARPLILIDTLFTYNESMILHPSKFVSISTINAQKAIALYGSNGRFGVIMIETIPDIEFVRLNAILDRFKVEEKHRSLKVCIDRAPVAEPDKLLADMKEIRNVEIISEKQPDANERFKDRSFINIITQPTF